MKKLSCPVFSAADVVGKKWGIAIIQEVELHGNDGFNAMARRLPKLTPKMLSIRLKDLEKQGILERKVVTNRIPVRTAYQLTSRGAALIPIITDLKKWEVRFGKAPAGCANRVCAECPLC